MKPTNTIWANVWWNSRSHEAVFKEYRGYIYAERRASGDLLVINYVGTDDYVSSVLGKEMSYSWPKEALKAQAVASYTYMKWIKENSDNPSSFGADITVNENEIVINKAPLHKSERILSGHNDHRVVMSLMVISSLYGGEIEGAEAVKKSYPDFFETLELLGGYFNLSS